MMDVPQDPVDDAIEIRWIMAGDIPAVLAITEEVAIPIVTEQAITALLATNTATMNANVGYLATCNGEVIGYAIGDVMILQHAYTIRYGAVRKDWRRRGIGSLLLNRFMDKIKYGRRSAVRVFVRESQVAAQLFLKAKGFTADEIRRGFYPETDEAAYVFTYSTNRR